MVAVTHVKHAVVRNQLICVCDCGHICIRCSLAVEHYINCALLIVIYAIHAIFHSVSQLVNQFWSYFSKLKRFIVEIIAEVPEAVFVWHYCFCRKLRSSST